MTEQSALAASIRQLGIAYRAQRLRTFDREIPARFSIAMHNSFLTTQGETYRWNRLVARYLRSANGPSAGTMAARSYAWETVTFEQGDAGSAETIDWTFARGAQFRALLIGVEGDMRIAPGSASSWRGGPEVLSFDLAYATLPKAPAVNLLRLMSWDVVTFEMLTSQIGTLTDFARHGESRIIERLSNAWTRLDFAEYASTSSFKNGVLSATLLGYGVWHDQPCALYAFSCDCSRLDVHADPNVADLAQRGSSFYAGKLAINVENGDIVAGDMLETIIATQIQHGKHLPVQKQRRVELAVAPASGDQDRHDTSDVSRAWVTHPFADAPIAKLQPLCTQALQQSRSIEVFVAEHQLGFQSLPTSLQTLGAQGFQIMTGKTMSEQHYMILELIAILKALIEGTDPHADVVFRTHYASIRVALEGFALYLQLAPEEAVRMQLIAPDALDRLTSTMRAAEEQVTVLLEQLRVVDGLLSFEHNMH